ncbi:HNH endonuclease [Rudanella lutea]|uniref:HNH endonuclease n=1 Tax=Rudanella lutea TaxID=451374 RepID=UPI000366069F|nr:HNH endonuclease [Rudanella lutea]
MRCIFCKQESSGSKSVEHIVPESLGNKSYVLPAGIVCDKCNQYFALKIEKILLEQEFFKNFRHRNKIESKRGRIPKGKVIVPETLYEADVLLTKQQPAIVLLNSESFELVSTGKVDHLIIPYVPKPEKNNQHIARFLGKVTLESFAQRLLVNEEWLEQWINDNQFDLLRNYVRYNLGVTKWNYNVRQIYAEDEKFFYPDGSYVDMVFESDFLYTRHGELYFTLALKGYEFTINVGGPNLDGYVDWLKENDNDSPLYRSKNFAKHVPQPIRMKT